MLLKVNHLGVTFKTMTGEIRPVNDVSFTINAGERVAVVGESGSGKTTLGLSLMRLVERLGGRIDPTSSVEFRGHDLMRLRPRAMRTIRGREIGMIFQDPMTSLNPVYTVGDQIVEAIRIHQREVSRPQARAQAVELLERMGVARARERLGAYPHEFSGGMRQRVMIAIAVSCGPSLLIADEPTTALDVTVQSQIMYLLLDLVADRNLSVILITHDLGIVAGFADRVLVMYAGRIVEAAPTAQLFHRPEHPYTAGLLEAIARLDAPRARRLVAVRGRPPNLHTLPSGCAFHPRCVRNDGALCVEVRPRLEPHQPGTQPSACHHAGEVRRVDLRRETGLAQAKVVAFDQPPLVDVVGLTKVFRGRGGTSQSGDGSPVAAVDGVSFSIWPGESFGLVGESGSGKTTTGRCVLRLVEPSAGEVTFDGHNILTLRRSRLRALRRDMQMIFQDPHASLDPRLRVEDLVAEPMHIHGLWGNKGYDRARVLELLELVGLNAQHARRYPAAFSGGERQRIGIARALAVRPKFLVCDEPVSSLDVSIRAQIVNLLMDLQDEFRLTYMFIAHDLALVRHICDRVAVMNDGKIVEVADCNELYANPQHPYTKALLAAVPIPEPPRESHRLEGERAQSPAGQAGLADGA